MSTQRHQKNDEQVFELKSCFLPLAKFKAIMPAPATHDRDGIIWGARYLTGENPKSCLGQVFNSKLGRITILRNKCMALHAATSRVENSVQRLSCQLKFVHGSFLFFVASPTVAEASK